MIADTLIPELARLDAAGLRRRRRTVDAPCGPRAVVDGREVVAFCSNDYLGLANDPQVIEALVRGAQRWGAGSGASHLVSGHLGPHERLEFELADFVRRPRALLFSTGYMANLGVVPALVGRGDAIFADRLNHASLIDAARLARAKMQRYPHADMAALARLLAASTAPRKLILSDSVFSMDGDLAPLPELFELAERHDAWLLVDDAHGFGVLGRQGRGSLDHFSLPASPRLLHMGTLGKAAGVAGAFVAGAEHVIEWLLQQARTHIYTTAAPPALSAALSTSLRLIGEGETRRRHLFGLVDRLRRGLAGLPWPLLPSSTAIQPLVVGSNEAALALADDLFAAGLWVPAIRPPSVPAGAARLRITLSAAHTAAEIDTLVGSLRGMA